MTISAMHVIRDTRIIPLPAPAGMSVEGRERIVGFDARWSGRGVVYERHVPVEIVATTDGHTEAVPIENQGPMRRLLPYLAAPVLAILVKRLFRAKG